MDASAVGKRWITLPHLMLHRNIINARSRQLIPAIGRCRSAPRSHLLTVSPISAMLLKLHRKIAAGGACPAGRGEDTVIGVDSLIIMLIVGAIAGWLAGQIVRGFGFGLLWNIVIGIVGAFIGVWLLQQLGFIPFAGFIGSIVNATIGAVILLIIVGFIRR
jgi:uncharacterized membrane protein YeaQ/YmgE (transglycosylase-associated protein family)